MRPSEEPAIAGFHSLPTDCATTDGAVKRSPSSEAAKIRARPLRQPCHATQTLPCESVAAAGSISEPASFEIWITGPATPPVTLRAKMSKLPRLFCDQNTQV